MSSVSDVCRDFITQKLERDADSILKLKGGAAIDLVDRALQKVLQNIADINTTMGTREVTLKVRATPVDDGRTTIKYEMEVPPPKLCGQEKFKCTADLKIDANGRGHYSKEKVDPQQGLPFSNVHKL